jgi:hypothetical protein
MNLLWFIRYFAIALGCSTPLLDVLWILSNRLKHELDLLLIPIEFQLQEWEYSKSLDEHWTWCTNPRHGPRIAYNAGFQRRISFQFSQGMGEFHVFVGYPKNTYVYRNHYCERKEFENRELWVNALLRMASRTVFAAGELYSHVPVTLGPWTRIQGIWKYE